MREQSLTLERGCQAAWTADAVVLKQKPTWCVRGAHQCGASPCPDYLCMLSAMLLRRPSTASSTSACVSGCSCVPLCLPLLGCEHLVCERNSAGRHKGRKVADGEGEVHNQSRSDWCPGSIRVSQSTEEEAFPPDLWSGVRVVSQGDRALMSLIEKGGVQEFSR